MGYFSKSLAKMLVVFHGWGAFIPNVAQAVDSRDDATHLIFSPLPGKIVQMFVETGQQVKKGDNLCTVEAMKMQHLIQSDFWGKIHSIFFKVDDSIESNSSLMVLLPSEAIPQPSNLPPFSAPPSNQGKENKALPIFQGENALQAPAPSNAFPPSLLWFSAENSGPLSEPPASIALDISPPSSFAFPVFPGATNPLPASPPDNGDKPGKGDALDAHGKAAGLVFKPPAQPTQPVHPQEALVPSDKIEKPFLKKSREKETAHSMNGFPNMFPQERPQGFFKPALLDNAGYSVVACAQWMAGLMVLAHILFTLKIMACSPLINPLSKITWLRAVDFSNPKFAAIPQKAHNKNRIERGRARKRKVA